MSIPIDYINLYWNYVLPCGALSSSFSTGKMLEHLSLNRINSNTLVKNENMRRVFPLKNTILGSSMFDNFKLDIKAKPKTIFNKRIVIKKEKKAVAIDRVEKQLYESDCAFYIYFDDTMTKVGISHKPLSRKARHERDMNRELSIYMIKWFRSKQKAMEFENKVKRGLTKAGHRKTGGEWFQIHPQIAYDLCIRLFKV